MVGYGIIRSWIMLYLVDFFRVAGTISEGRLRYSRRYSIPLSVRNLV
jgi:hypothetical protein